MQEELLRHPAYALGDRRGLSDDIDQHEDLMRLRHAGSGLGRAEYRVLSINAELHGIFGRVDRTGEGALDDPPRLLGDRVGCGNHARIADATHRDIPVPGVSGALELYV